MAEFEDALSALESNVVAAGKSADGLSKALRRLLSAVRSGNIQQIEKSLLLLPSLGGEAQAAATDLPGRWQFDVRGHMESGYLAELLDEAAQAGLTLFERDGRIYAFPLMLRLVPADAAIRIAQATERGIRPKEVVRKLKALQSRPQRLGEQRFLDLLYRAYQRLAASDWRRVEHGSGPAIILSEIHEVLTLLPGSEYSIAEFGRDLLLLDRQPTLKARDGSGFRLVGSTLGRTAKKIVVYDEAGNTREFVAIAFVEEILSVAISADDWLRVVEREYLAKFVPGGGSAVKVVVGSDADLELVDAGLQTEAQARQLTTLRVDAAITRIHMIQNVFFAIAQGIDWRSLAQGWIEEQFRANGYRWPRPGEPVPLRDLAEHNNVAENLLLRAVNDWLTRGISREHEMAQDFRNAMVHLCLACLEPPDPLSSPPVLGWLNGTLRTIGALRDVPIGAKITRNNGRAMLRSLCHWLSLAATPGIVVRLDLRHLSSPGAGPAGEPRYTPSAILDAFEVLRQFIDDSHLFKGFLLVVLAADALLDGEPRRSILAYSALRQRLESDVRSVTHDNPLAPLVRLGRGGAGVVLSQGDMTFSGERVTIEALRAGVPPNGEATRRLGTDEHAIENAFVDGLKRVREAAAGDGVVAGRLVAGEFGAGKSHLLGYLAEQALIHDFVVSKVTISKETPLFNPERVFAAAIRNAVVQEVNDDIMRVVIERLLDRTEELQRLEAAISLPESGFAAIFAALLHILPKNVVNAEDRAAIARFFGGARLGTPRVRAWLRGAGSIKLFDLGSVRAADLAQQRILLAPLLFQAAGFSGWCLMFDELELIARYSTLQRGKSYAELARWLALDRAVAIRGTVAIGAMTSDFKDEVFGRRLDQEKVPAVLQARDLDQSARLAGLAMSTIEKRMQELMRPDATRLGRSLEDARWNYEKSYGWKPPASGVGELRAGKPIREFVKSWITGWDIERLYGTRDAIEVQTIPADYTENLDLEKPSGPASDEDEA